MYQMDSDDDDTKIEYRNSDGKLHRNGGLHALERPRDGYKSWWVNGFLHREGGLPAIECADGTKLWWVNGDLHRDGGLPAIDNINGDRNWYVNGERHREGGLPAVERSRDGYTAWWINGNCLTNEEGLAYMTFCQKMLEKKRIRAQKKIYFWWIQICYDLEHHSGCGQRMAQRNLNVYENMMKLER